MTAQDPNPVRVPPAWGGPLAEQDYSMLSGSWITRELADQAMLRRVDAHVGPPFICFPLLAATTRAALGKADFALHLSGENGAFKTELAALFQRHFGAAMDRLHLPGAWSSTANALEMAAFQAKDTLRVVDDFAP